MEESTSRFSHLFLDAVTEDPVLNPLAETAYTSFLRAYASFSGELRQFFTFKRLHLGHVARAFGLTATPKDIASRVTGRFRGLQKSAKPGKSGSRKRSADEDTEVSGQLAPKRCAPANILFICHLFHRIVLRAVVCARAIYVRLFRGPSLRQISILYLLKVGLSFGCRWICQSDCDSEIPRCYAL